MRLRSIAFALLAIAAAHFVLYQSSGLQFRLLHAIGFWPAHYLVRAMQAIAFLYAARTVGRVLDAQPRIDALPDGCFPIFSALAAVALFGLVGVLETEAERGKWASDLVFVVVGVGSGPWLLRLVGPERWDWRRMEAALLQLTFGMLVVFDAAFVYWIPSHFFRVLYLVGFFGIGSANVAWYFEWHIGSGRR